MPSTSVRKMILEAPTVWAMAEAKVSALTLTTSPSGPTATLAMTGM